MINTEIIILAAGKGTRMGTEIPKSLVHVKGMPMLERLLLNIKKSLINTPIVVVGHKAEEIENYIGDRARYTRQIEQKGTAHATQVALEALLPNTENIVVLYADHPFVRSETIEGLISKLDENILAIATTDAGDFSGWKTLFKHWGRIIYSKLGLIDGIIEYKDADENTRLISTVNPGYYAFKVDWLKGALKKVKPINSQGEYYLTDVIRMAREDNLLIGEVKIDLLEAMGLNTKSEIEYAESLM